MHSHSQSQVISSGLQGDTKREMTSATGAERDLNDAKTSAREAAACFWRQVALLKSLNRFSTPLPHLEAEVRKPASIAYIGVLHRPKALSLLAGRVEEFEPSRRQQNLVRRYCTVFAKPSRLPRGNQYKLAAIILGGHGLSLLTNNRSTSCVFSFPGSTDDTLARFQHRRRRVANMPHQDSQHQEVQRKTEN